MKFKNQVLKKLGLAVCILVGLLSLASCEKEDEQITNPPPANLITKSSELVELMTKTATKSIEGTSCITFQYPISFSIYNTQFQVADTVFVATDMELLDFLNSLDDSIIVANNFPLTVIEGDKRIIAPNNNALTSALLNAPDDCDDPIDDPDCTLLDVSGSLSECGMYITTYNDMRTFIDYKLRFNRSDVLEVFFFDKLVSTDNYTLNQDGDDFFLDIQSNWEVINGNWRILNCDSFSDITLQRGSDTMSLQGCGFTPEVTDNPLECFKDFTNSEVIDENSDNVEFYNLTSINNACAKPDVLNVTYHTTKSDAEQNINPIVSVNEFEITSTNTQIFSRVEFKNNVANFQVNEINLALKSNNSSQNNCTVDSTRNLFYECPMRISAFNDNTSTYSDYVLTFGVFDDSLTRNGLDTPGTYMVNKLDDGTFTVTINISNDDLNGVWNIENCEFSTLVNLTKGSDHLSLVRSCNN